MLTLVTAAVLLALPPGPAAPGSTRTVIYAETVTEVRADPEATKDLWLTLADLTRATNWEVKPEGVCAAKECIPLPADRKKEFFADRAGASWFNLSAFGRLLKQPTAHDAKYGVWYFGPRPEAQNAHVATRTAPDFTLPDHTGKPRSLAEFRGRKVLLITWASW